MMLKLVSPLHALTRTLIPVPLVRCRSIVVAAGDDDPLAVPSTVTLALPIVMVPASTI